jgi:hypothetical protein
MNDFLDWLSDLPTPVKFGISIAWDIGDFFAPPVIETFTDILGGVLAFALWQAPVLSIVGTGVEVADVTGRVDAFLPTLTLTGIASEVFD